MTIPNNSYYGCRHKTFIINFVKTDFIVIEPMVVDLYYLNWHQSFSYSSTKCCLNAIAKLLGILGRGSGKRRGVRGGKRRTGHLCHNRHCPILSSFFIINDYHHSQCSQKCVLVHPPKLKQSSHHSLSSKQLSYPNFSVRLNCI